MEAPVVWHPEFRLALARFAWGRSGFISPDGFWKDGVDETEEALLDAFEAAGIPFTLTVPEGI